MIIIIIKNSLYSTLLGLFPTDGCITNMLITITFIAS